MAYFGATTMSDWDATEYGKQLPPTESKLRGLGDCKKETDDPNRARRISKPIPGMIDWVEKGYTTAIKNQNPLPDCWAYSAVEQVESQFMIEHNYTFPDKGLSAQMLYDCVQGKSRPHAWMGPVGAKGYV